MWYCSMMTDCRYLLCPESLVRTLLVFKAWNRQLVLDPSMADKTSLTQEQEPGQEDTLAVKSLDAICKMYFINEMEKINSLIGQF